MPELRDLMALAMKARVAGPLMNIPSLEPVLAGSLGDAWPYIADAALAAIEAAGFVVVHGEDMTGEQFLAATQAYERDGPAGPYSPLALRSAYRAALAARPRDAAPTEDKEDVG